MIEEMYSGDGAITNEILQNLELARRKAPYYISKDYRGGTPYNDKVQPRGQIWKRGLRTRWTEQ